MTGAPDGTVLRLRPDRSGRAFVAVFTVAAVAVAAGTLGLGAAARWPLAAVCLLLAGATAASLVRRSARTEVTSEGLVLRRPGRTARYAWADVEGFDAVDPHEDPDASARLGRRVRMRLRRGEPLLLPGIAGPEADRAAAALSARLTR